MDTLEANRITNSLHSIENRLDAIEKYIGPSEIKWMPEGWIPDRRGLYWWKEDADTAATIVNVWDSNDPYNGDALDMLGFIDGDEACLYAVGGRFSSLLIPPPDVEGG